MLLETLLGLRIRRVDGDFAIGVRRAPCNNGVRERSDFRDGMAKGVLQLKTILT